MLLASVFDPRIIMLFAWNGNSDASDAEGRPLGYYLDWFPSAYTYGLVLLGVGMEVLAQGTSHVRTDADGRVWDETRSSCAITSLTSPVTLFSAHSVSLQIFILIKVCVWVGWVSVCACIMYPPARAVHHTLTLSPPTQHPRATMGSAQAPWQPCQALSSHS